MYPKDISVNRVQTSCLCLTEQTRPHIGRRAWIMNGTGHDKLALSINDNRAMVDGDIAAEALNRG